MIEYIYVCRHGFRSNRVDSSITTSPTGMQRDPPLASYGIDQSKHLAQFLLDPEHKSLGNGSSGSSADFVGEGSPARGEEHPPPPEIVFSSPFYRCIQTALALAELLVSSSASTSISNSSASSTTATSTVPKAIHLEHGIQEWYSGVKPNTGLHPRPARADRMRGFFPDGLVLGEGSASGSATGASEGQEASGKGKGQEAEIGWRSTFWPSREGEGLEDLNDRIDGCLDALIPRIEATYPSVRSIALYGHAASVIAIGKSLTGNPKRDVRAGCASTSLYRRKPQRNGDDNTSEGPSPPSTASTLAETTLVEVWESGSTTSAGLASAGLTSREDVGSSTTGSTVRSGGSTMVGSVPKIGKSHLGDWEGIWNGRADYLPNGEERNWSFADILLNEAGDVIHDDGDHIDHSTADAPPVGLDEASLRYSSGLHLKYRPAHDVANRRAEDKDVGSLVEAVSDTVRDALGLKGAKL